MGKHQQQQRQPAASAAKPSISRLLMLHAEELLMQQQCKAIKETARRIAIERMPSYWTSYYGGNSNNANNNNNNSKPGILCGIVFLYVFMCVPARFAIAMSKPIKLTAISIHSRFRRLIFIALSCRRAM